MFNSYDRIMLKATFSLGTINRGLQILWRLNFNVSWAQNIQHLPHVLPSSLECSRTEHIFCIFFLYCQDERAHWILAQMIQREKKLCGVACIQACRSNASIVAWFCSRVLSHLVFRFHGTTSSASNSLLLIDAWMMTRGNHLTASTFYAQTHYIYLYSPIEIIHTCK